jgi:hypothetical protein
VPIAFKENWRYDGITPITFTYDKNWVTEQTITESTTQTKENTTTVNVSATLEIEAGWEVGAVNKFVGHVSASATAGKEWASTASTANTYEVAKAKSEGESQGIATTIGEHREAPGVYRYAYFGVTDAYALYEVDKTTRAVNKVTFTTCARPASLAWGIDFDPDYANPKFGKTGGGEDLEIPDLDFTNAPAPTVVLEDDEDITPPPPPPPETIETTLTGWWAKQYAATDGGSSVTAGDNAVDSDPGEQVDWTFKIERFELINQRANGTYGALQFITTFTVYEKKGGTKIEMTRTHQADLTGRLVTEVLSTTQQVGGTYTFGNNKDTNHSLVYLTSANNDVIGQVWGKLDDSAKDDSNKLAYEAELKFRFVEKNPAAQ